MKTSTTLLVIGLVVVGYLLSPPVVVWCVRKVAPNYIFSRSYHNVIGVVYGPAFVVARAIPPYAQFMRAGNNWLGNF